MKRIALCYSDDCCKLYNDITHGVERVVKKTDWFCPMCNSALFWTTIGDNEQWSDYVRTAGKRKKTFRNELLVREYRT